MSEHDISSINGWVRHNDVTFARSGIHLLSIFGALGQLVEVLLGIFCGLKTTLEFSLHFHASSFSNNSYA